MSKKERLKAIKKANELARNGMDYIEAARVCGVMPSDVKKVNRR